MVEHVQTCLEQAQLLPKEFTLPCDPDYNSLDFTADCEAPNYLEETIQVLPEKT